MHHNLPYKDKFDKASAAQNHDLIATEKSSVEKKEQNNPSNEFVNSGVLSQSQLQRLFYRRQSLISKGEYKMGFLALNALSDGPMSTQQIYDILDNFSDRELIEDFVNGRVIGQSNHADAPQINEERAELTVEDFDPDAQSLIGAIQKTAAETGISQSYLIDLAFKESSFGANMVASTSSARGAFQFTDDTWLRVVKNYGDEIGLGHFKDAIDTSGRWASVNDDVLEKQILELRFNHDISTYMTAKLTLENKAALERALPGRDINETDLYMAHFLGAGRAIEFFKCLECNPNDIAASRFANEANSNKPVFYAKNGTGHTIADVYENFDRSFRGKHAINMAALEDRDHLKSIS